MSTNALSTDRAAGTSGLGRSVGILTDCDHGAGADFSRARMSRPGAQCHTVRPTWELQAALRAVAAQHGPFFRSKPVANLDGEGQRG
jgi:hypothetical protein